MRIGVPKETVSGERRVALVPEVVRKLVAKEHEVVIEAGAGQAAMIPDDLFTAAGAQVGVDPEADCARGFVVEDGLTVLAKGQDVAL